MAACDFSDPHTLNFAAPETRSTVSQSGKSEEVGKPLSVGRLYDFTLYDIDERPVSLSRFRGRVLLIVNTASRCGYTGQYGQLQQLYEQYHPKGFEVLAFPSNDFGGQELATNEEIAKFCYTRYSVGFPLFGKTRVRGSAKHPLYQYLTEQVPFPGEVRWNFQKYLVSRSSTVIARYPSSVVSLSD